jgi:phospholipid/cholesterol/gamma-HCH transport system ATP-binding protein
MPSSGGFAAPSGRDLDAARTADIVRERLAKALTADSPLVTRLPKADTSVAIEIEDRDGARSGLTLLLDRRPPAVLEGVRAAEITLVLSVAQAMAFAHGALKLAPQALTGCVRCSGPARKFLAVEPVMRSLLRASAEPNGVWSGNEELTGLAAIAPIASPDVLAVETRDLRKRFGRQQILDGISLQVPEGALSVVMGPSGTGKSVLLKHVIGLLRPDSGDVLVRGRPLSRMRQSEVHTLRRGVGVMFQDGALFSSMSIYDNVAFPLRQHTDLREHQVRELVMQQLVAVGLADARKKSPAELSGGMRKRAGLARSLVLDPGIVLCDEPDSGLDPVRTALLGELLVNRHAARGGTMIVVTHDTDLARLIADHVSVIWRGKVVEAGPAESVWNSEHPFVRQFLSGRPRGPLQMDG